jgi:hypothetical protein
MTWQIPTQRQRIPVAGSGQTAETSQLSAAVLQDRSLRADRFGALLAMVRAGDVQTPARDWIIDPANYGVAPSAGVYPFRVIEGVTATIPLPLPRSDGRTVGTGSGFDTRGGMRIGTRGRRVHLRVTLTDLETSATNSVVIEHGTADDWQNVDLALPLGSRSGNRIRVDVDARWTDDSEPARIGAVCCWWGGAQDIRGTGIVMFGDATVWIEDSFASRPALNLRDGDLLLIDGGATTEEGWSFRYDLGSGEWRVVMATAATWAVRPLPGSTLPSGAALDSGSRLRFASMPELAEFLWSGTRWVAVRGSASLHDMDVFPSASLYEITPGDPRATAASSATSFSRYVGAGAVGDVDISDSGTNRGTEGGVPHALHSGIGSNNSQALSGLSGVSRWHTFRVQKIGADARSKSGLTVVFSSTLTAGAAIRLRDESGGFREFNAFWRRAAQGDSSSSVDFGGGVVPADDDWHVLGGGIDVSTATDNLTGWVDDPSAPAAVGSGSSAAGTGNWGGTRTLRLGWVTTGDDTLPTRWTCVIAGNDALTADQLAAIWAIAESWLPEYDP